MSIVDYSHLEWAHPVVRDWFLHRFGSATEPQIRGWPHILNGHTTLVSAPTGSGKTLAAFLACLDQLVRKALNNELSNQVEIIYVSPLKALSNDIQTNLQVPLREIADLAAERSLSMAEIRIAVRTGDTLMPERQAMLRKPPHILVTTPESLYILLTAEKSRAMLRNVRTVIVDEIHAIADDKRGAHLALSLERLDALTEVKPNRIGLSATQKPIELISEFLTGSGDTQAMIVNVPDRRKLDLAIEIPDLPLGAVASNEMWESVYKRICSLINEHRSTLIFVNTRKHAERVAMHLSKLLGEDVVATHHGSLSQKIRLAAERKLKNGEVKVLVATASLELGIDIGFVDLVCQIGSPRAIATAVQRIGRAGHWRGATPKGRLFALTRDELVELAALVMAMNKGDLDQLTIPDSPLDILAQQIVAMCAVEEWNEDALFVLIKRAYPYRSLKREQYDRLISMLSNGISAQRGRYGAYLMHDQVQKRLKGRRGARLVAITNGGAIPESNTYAVLLEPEEIAIGTLDEDFAIESNIGDIILLGNSSWRIRRVDSRTGRVFVDDAHGAPPTVPFWLGEGPARTVELSEHVSILRQFISECIAPPNSETNPPNFNKAISWLKSNCGVNDAGSSEIIQYITNGHKVLGVVPTKSTIVAERFFDEGGGMQLIIHAPFGAKINKAWGLALRKKFCRSFNFELQAAATDNGLNISLGEQHSFPLIDVFYYLSPKNIRYTLEQAVLAAPVFTTRWRWDASRSLSLLRFSGGKKVPPYLQRLKADDLLAAVFPAVIACQDNQTGDIELPEHPLIEEVMKDVLFEAMDLNGLQEILNGIANSDITCIAIDTVAPSVFSHEILNANPYAYLDDAPLEERRSRAVEMRRILPADIIQKYGQLDPDAVDRVLSEAWPDIRDRDELHDLLLTLVALPEELPSLPHPSPKQVWLHFFEQLVTQRRASRATVGSIIFWVAAERKEAFELVFENVRFDHNLPSISSSIASYDQVLQNMLLGWMSLLGPVGYGDLHKLLPLPLPALEISLLKLEGSGNILRGIFTNRIDKLEHDGQFEWCDRRLLARIHSLTLIGLRQQIEPVTPALFIRWLAHWQHAAPGTQLNGENGTLEVLKQLQGFEIPANAWEKQILARRVTDYSPAMLDHLCFSGAIGWGRLSPHPAILKDGLNGTVAKNHRVIPTAVAPITFFVRDQADWLNPHSCIVNRDELSGLSSAAQLVEQFLAKRGANFFTDIERATGLLKAEVENALWELVTAGLVTADGFDNIRALIDPKRRAGLGKARSTRPRHSSGRWYLLYTECMANREKMIDAMCQLLLHRYGIVFRDLIARETNLPSWRELLSRFRFMENQGKIRSGRFISGFVGEQFALPTAIESLRAMRKRESPQKELTLSAVDPLNLVGIILPGEKIPALSNKVFTLFF